MISFKKPFKKSLKNEKKNKDILTLTPFPLAKISLFLILKKLGFQIDPLPPFRNFSKLKLFYGFPKSLYSDISNISLLLFSFLLPSLGFLALE